MRVFFLALMILTLPIRGWTADVMGIQMAMEKASSHAVVASGHHQNAITIIAINDHSSGATVDFHPQISAQTANDCAGHAAAAVVGSGPASDSHCGACAACQTCHSVAITTAAAPVAPLLSASALQQIVSDSFASASPVLSQKPPIS